MHFCQYCDQLCKNKGLLTIHQAKCKKNTNRIPSWNEGQTKHTNSSIASVAAKLSGRSRPDISDKLKGRKSNSPGKSLDPVKEQERRQKIRKSALDRKIGGYVKGSGRGKKGWYKGFFCDSSWELAYVIYCLDHAICIERNLERRQYEWNGVVKNYIPDFVVDGKLVEIKGYKTEQWMAKLKCNPDITVMYETDLKDVLSYVNKQYGKNFINMYE